MNEITNETVITVPSIPTQSFFGLCSFGSTDRPTILRVYRGKVQAEERPDMWTTLSLTNLSRTHRSHSELWTWLATYGLKPVALSGPSGTRKAPRRRVEYTPSPEASAALDRLWRRISGPRSRIIDRLVLAEDEAYRALEEPLSP